MAHMTLIKRGLLVGGCTLMLAGCGKAAAAGQHSDRPVHKPAITVSDQAPPPIPGTGWSFAPYTNQSNSPQLISAVTALAAAKNTGIDSGAWTSGTTPTATLVEFTNTYQNTAAKPAWIVYANNVPITPPVGPVATKGTNPSQFVGYAEWIIDAQTGAYIMAGDA